MSQGNSIRELAECGYFPDRSIALSDRVKTKTIWLAVPRSNGFFVGKKGRENTVSKNNILFVWNLITVWEKQSFIGNWIKVKQSCMVLQFSLYYQESWFNLSEHQLPVNAPKACLFVYIRYAVYQYRYIHKKLKFLYSWKLVWNGNILLIPRQQQQLLSRIQSYKRLLINENKPPKKYFVHIYTHQQLRRAWQKSATIFLALKLFCCRRVSRWTWIFRGIGARQLRRASA